MPDWIIRSKLQPPTRLGELVPRMRLAERLDSIFDARLALVHAPAGFGKSTCLAQWRNTLLDRDIPAAWLSLDEHDTNLFQFLTYVIEACNEAGFAAGRDFPKISEEYAVLSGSEISAAVVTGFNKCNGSHVIVLDDFHRAQSSEVTGFIDYLLSACPPNVHIVISTRELPSELPLADRRIHDELVELTQEDLRFSKEEIRTYLDYWVDASANSEWPAELHERTEGWPVALHTVRRWVSEGATIEQTLSQLSGRTSDLADYFLEQVFDSLTDEVRGFLLTTSILERINGDLGGALCKHADGWEVLQNLDQKDIFIQSLDRHRTWYRYHRLFSEFLQERLRRSQGTEVAELHLSAADWFYEHGHTAEAVQHTIASGDVSRCAALLEKLGGWRYALEGQVAVVQGVLAKIDDQELRRYPRLWLAKIYMATRLGNTEHCEAEIARFEQAYIPGQSIDAELSAEAKIMKGAIQRYADKPVTAESIASLEKLDQDISPENNVSNAARCNLLCAMYRDVGRFDDCMAVGDQAISQYRKVSSVYGEAFIYFHEGLACLRQARLRDAESLYKEGCAIAVDVFGEDSDLAAIGYAFMAEVSYEKNRLHEARQYLAKSVRHIEKADAWLEVYLAAYLTQMKLMWTAAEKKEIERTITSAKSTAINRGLDRLGSIVRLQSLELLLRGIPGTEQEPANNALSAAVEARAGDEIGRHFGVRIKARTLLMNGDHEHAARLLEKEAQSARESRHIQFFISLAILLAAARWRSGDKDAAIGAFESALSVAIFEGIKRPFIDEGELLDGVIREVSQSAENRRGNRLRDAFIAELVAEIAAAGKDRKQDEHLLSPREREVLRYVMQGQSNREIAEAMPLSVNTVKFHLKNIFGKLGVSSRKDAVSLAVRQRLF